MRTLRVGGRRERKRATRASRCALQEWMGSRCQNSWGHGLEEGVFLLRRTDFPRELRPSGLMGRAADSSPPAVIPAFRPEQIWSKGKEFFTW